MAVGDPGPAGFSIFIPSGPALDPKTVDLKTIDPFYEGDLGFINDDERLALQRNATNKDRARRIYEMNVSQVGASGGGGGDYGIAAAERAAALEREKAARDDANFRENMRERLASRGALDSGQFGWENKEADWQLGMMNRQIESDLQGRRDAASAARADAQAGLASRLAEMKMKYEFDQMDFDDNAFDISQGAGRARGSAYKDAYKRAVENGAFLPPGETAILQADGTYMTRSGKRYDANMNPITGNTGGGGGGGGDAPSPVAAPDFSGATVSRSGYWGME